MKLITLRAYFDSSGVFQYRFGSLSDEYRHMRGVSINPGSGSARYAPLGYAVGNGEFFIDHNGKSEGTKFSLSRDGQTESFAPFYDKSNSPSGDLAGFYDPAAFGALNLDHLPGGTNIESLTALVNSQFVVNARVIQLEEGFIEHEGVTFRARNILLISLLVDDDVVLAVDAPQTDSTFLGRRQDDGSYLEVTEFHEAERRVDHTVDDVSVKDGDFASFLAGVQSMKVALEKAK